MAVPTIGAALSGAMDLRLPAQSGRHVVGEAAGFY